MVKFAFFAGTQWFVRSLVSLSTYPSIEEFYCTNNCGKLLRKTWTFKNTTKEFFAFLPPLLYNNIHRENVISSIMIMTCLLFVIQCNHIFGYFYICVYLLLYMTHIFLLTHHFDNKANIINSLNN